MFFLSLALQGSHTPLSECLPNPEAEYIHQGVRPGYFSILNWTTSRTPTLLTERWPLCTVAFESIVTDRGAAAAYHDKPHLLHRE
jgi:hypothetical protein